MAGTSGMSGSGGESGGESGSERRAPDEQFEHGNWKQPPLPTAALVTAGLALGAAGDLLLRQPDGIGLNISAWVTLVAIAAVLLFRQMASELDRRRFAWLAIGALFAAALSWRDAPFLKVLALGTAALGFAVAAYRADGAWVRRAGVVRYGVAFVLAAVHAWLGGILVAVDLLRSAWPFGSGGARGWRRAAALTRGLALALPLVGLFALLFMSADAVFADLVAHAFRFDFEWVVSNVVVLTVMTWLASGYLRGFLTGTDVPPQRLALVHGAPFGITPRRPTLGLTEIATVLSALDLLFLLFVIIQFRYLFGGDALVQVTPNLTYAEYARRGFFELVVAVVLVVPVLLAADWLLDSRAGEQRRVFRWLAGVQIALVLAITVSAAQRLRLYHATYGLTETRYYAMVLLAWVGLVLLWLAATVLRDRRDAFGFGALVSGCVTVAVLLVASPDALIARTNLARFASPDAGVRFDVAYATSLSADAVPVLVDALPTLPADVQCRLARYMLDGWPPQQSRSIRSWNWSQRRAASIIRAHQSQLRAMLDPSVCSDENVR